MGRKEPLLLSEGHCDLRGARYIFHSRACGLGMKRSFPAHPGERLNTFSRG